MLLDLYGEVIESLKIRAQCGSAVVLSRIVTFPPAVPVTSIYILRDKRPSHFSGLQHSLCTLPQVF